MCTLAKALTVIALLSFAPGTAGAFEPLRNTTMTPGGSGGRLGTVPSMAVPHVGSGLLRNTTMTANRHLDLAAVVFSDQNASGGPLGATDVGGLSLPEFVDIDSDGDFDLFIGENLGSVLFFENVGSAEEPVFEKREGPDNPLDLLNASEPSPSFSDIDGDGDFDAVIGVGNLLLFPGDPDFDPEEPVVLFENVGTAFAPLFEPRTGANNPFRALKPEEGDMPAFVDLDADGDDDLVLGSGGGILRSFERTGPPESPIYEELVGTDNPFRVIFGDRSRLALADYDGDGDTDALVGDRLGEFDYFENVGTAQSATFEARTGAENPIGGFDIGGYSSPTAADLDGDGDLDLLSGETHGQLFFFENGGSGARPQFDGPSTNNPVTAAGIGLYFDTGTAVGDLDADGDLDLFIGELAYPYFFAPNVRFATNLGTPSATALFEVASEDNPLLVQVDKVARPSLVDIDADDDLDAFVGGTGGDDIVFYENLGTPIHPAFEIAANPLEAFSGSAAPAFVDLDGDADSDAFIGKGNGEITQFENLGGALFPDFLRVPDGEDPLDFIDVGSRATPGFVDLDFDCDPDLFVGSTDEGLAFFENVGSARLPEFAERTGSENPLALFAGERSQPTFGDLDGDGDQDVLVSSQNAIYYYRNDTLAVAITLTPEMVPLIIPTDGGDLTFSVFLSNNTLQEIDVDVWADVVLEDGTTHELFGPIALTLPEGGQIDRHLTETIPDVAPAGPARIRLSTGTYPDSPETEACLAFFKEG